MEIVDYIIVGSGCTAAMAAQTLCDAGVQVLMIDAGITDKIITEPQADFIETRCNNDDQSVLFLGKKLEALSDATHPNIPQQTAQRSFMSVFTNQFLSVTSANFFPVESLALGGLGNGWGLGSYAFSEAELKKCKLPVAEMHEAYKVIADRIGISGNKEDAAALFCHNQLFDVQDAIQLNPSAASLYKKYQKQKEDFKRKGLFMGRPSMALLTQEKDDRKAYMYKDLDFYANEGNSAYRPNITIQQLVAKRSLRYVKGWLVLSFIEADGITSINCLNIETNEKQQFHTRKLILCAGALGTARIVLRSLKGKEKLPVLCNAYTYMPMVYLPFIGKKHTGKFSGLAQLAMFYDKAMNHENVVMASIYNYRSLLNFRILKQMPLNHSDGLKFLQLLLPALFIAGIFHPAELNASNYIQLNNAATPTGDSLHTHYIYSKDEENIIRLTEKVYSRAFLQLQCIALKKMRTPTGGSIHYAGTLPFSNTEKLFHISPNGKLYGTENVFVADGSGFSFLPGKGLTLSLMAYAHVVTSKVVSHA